MSRNDLCFCGSGKKQKKCHADVNEKSVIANLLYLFNQLDTENQKCLNEICHNGCGDCCVDDFKISSVEFFCILHYLIDNNKINIINEAIDRSKEKHNNNDTGNKCVFYNELHNNCNIYPVRPITCRKYGYDARITDCPKIINAYNKVNLLNYSNIDCLKNITIFNEFATPPHEISYWFSLYEDGKFLIKRMQDLFECSKHFTINEFYRILTIKNDSSRNFDINEF